MIEIKNLHKSFGSNHVLKGIDLSIEDGEIYGLIGVSGAGKSTLLRCINGLEPYDSGSLRIDGTEVSTLSKKDMRRFRSGIGMIFQQFHLLERMTVYQNIAFPLRCWGNSKESTRQRVNELLALVELEDKKDARPAELSGGQKQRVAIARALAMNPRILLCDEATSALDPNITGSILELLKRINRQLGLTIIVVTHQMEVVKQICSRVSVLSQGVLKTTGDVKDIFIKKTEVLSELFSENLEVHIPNHGTTLEIIFQAEKDADLLSSLSRDTGAAYHLIDMQLDHYSSGSYGSFTINIEEKDFESVKQFLQARNTEWRELSHDN